MTDEKKLTPLMVLELLNKPGYTKARIAREYGVKRQAITHHINRLKEQGFEVPKTPLERAMEKLPESWATMDQKYKRAQPYNYVRHHLEYMATGGKGMPKYKLERLRSWYSRMENLNLILEFDPKHPADLHIPSGGWKYVTRRPSDDELVLRPNKYTAIPDKDLYIWRFPPKIP